MAHCYRKRKWHESLMPEKQYRLDNSEASEKAFLKYRSSFI